jgi:hypothetical protein
VKKTNGEDDGSRADAHQVSAVPASDDVDGESSAPPPQQQHGAAGAEEGGGDPAEAPAEGAEEKEEEEAPKGERFLPPPCGEECRHAKRKQDSFWMFSAEPATPHRSGIATHRGNRHDPIALQDPAPSQPCLPRSTTRSGPSLPASPQPLSQGLS